jgi:lysyl-tRNA synthetase class 2
LQDVEERFRKRYLDILMSPEVRDIFEKKSKFWSATRSFLKREGFLEVETPTIEITTGGAEARPFKTHHNDFDIEVYMRISVGELWQKRLLAAGFPRTFEIGRAYRNEGSSPEHLQEFTNMEFYAGYMDYTQGIEFTERMIKEVAMETFGTLQFETHGHSIDLSKNWEQISYVDTIKNMLGIDVLNTTQDEMKNKLEELDVKYDGENIERLTDSLWKYCRKQIVGPVWLVDLPKLVSPLSKAKPENPLLTERVQLILAGAECTNGFSELNDPIDQYERFSAQNKLIEAGDEEAMMPDWEFVEMLEHGMPPAFGFGYGERFFAFLVDKPIRDTQLFPLMKPKNQE